MGRARRHGLDRDAWQADALWPASSMVAWAAFTRSVMSWPGRSARKSSMALMWASMPRMRTDLASMRHRGPSMDAVSRRMACSVAMWLPSAILGDACARRAASPHLEHGGSPSWG